jgi:hypothetical protein
LHTLKCPTERDYLISPYARLEGSEKVVWKAYRIIVYEGRW